MISPTLYHSFLASIYNAQIGIKSAVAHPQHWKTAQSSFSGSHTPSGRGLGGSHHMVSAQRLIIDQKGAWVPVHLAPHLPLPVPFYTRKRKRTHFLNVTKYSMYVPSHDVGGVIGLLNTSR